MRVTLNEQGETDVVDCEDCGHNMVNVDANQITPADLIMLKKGKIRVSNPHTDNQLCLNCEVKSDWREKVTSWYDREDEDNDDDYVSGTFWGGGSSGGSSSFGGFGGGSFSGGGTSGSF